MEQLEEKDRLIAIHEEMLSNISDNLNIAVWAKDRDGKFLYANKVCKDTILMCKDKEVLNLSDKDFEDDILSKVCIISDQIVINRKESAKFIEHARYKDRDIWISSIKSPWIQSGVIIGTVGVGTNISDQISNEIKEKYFDLESLEVSLNAEISEIFNEL